VQTVNCIQTLTGINRFSYEMERGGGGICDSPNNVIVACQQPGSVYVDNQVFSVFYSTCPADSTSMPYGLSSAFSTVMGFIYVLCSQFSVVLYKILSNSITNYTELLFQLLCNWGPNTIDLKRPNSSW